MFGKPTHRSSKKPTKSTLQRVAQKQQKKGFVNKSTKPGYLETAPWERLGFEREDLLEGYHDVENLLLSPVYQTETGMHIVGVPDVEGQTSDKGRSVRLHYPRQYTAIPATGPGGEKTQQLAFVRLVGFDGHIDIKTQAITLEGPLSPRLVDAYYESLLFSQFLKPESFKEYQEAKAEELKDAIEAAQRLAAKADSEGPSDGDLLEKATENVIKKIDEMQASDFSTEVSSEPLTVNMLDNSKDCCNDSECELKEDPTLAPSPAEAVASALSNKAWDNGGVLSVENVQEVKSTFEEGDVNPD